VAVAALMLARAASEASDQAKYDKRLEAYITRPEVGTVMPMLLIIGSTRAGAILEEKPAPSAPTTPSRDGTKVYLQVGAFRDETNAKALSATLISLGLKALVKKGRGDLIVVLVDPGDNVDRCILTLKDAGYEAWIVDGLP
jgi:cell division protein FtsN